MKKKYLTMLLFFVMLFQLSATQALADNNIGETAFTSENMDMVSFDDERRIPSSMLLLDTAYADGVSGIRRGNTYGPSWNAANVAIDGRPDVGLHRVMFLKFDLSSWGDLVWSFERTQLRLSTYSDTNPSNEDHFEIYMLPQEMEQYIDDTLIYETAEKNGMLNNIGQKLYTSPALEARKSYTSDDFASALLEHLQNNPQDKIVSFKVISTTNHGYTIRGYGAGSTERPALEIGYLPNHQKDAYFLELPGVVDGNMTLPTTGVYGSEITWKSSDESIISSAGEVSVATANEDYSIEDNAVRLTATVSNFGQTEEREFLVRVRRKGIVDVSQDTFIGPDGNYADSDFIVFGKENGNVALLQFDLPQKTNVHDNRTIMLKLYAEELNGKRITAHPVTENSLKSIDISTVNLEDCAELKNYTSSYSVSTIGDASGYVVLDVTEYIWAQKDSKALFVLSSEDDLVVLRSQKILNSEPKLIYSPIVYTEDFGLEKASAKLTWDVLSSDEPTSVRKQINLPVSGCYGSVIHWSCSDSAVLDTTTGSLSRQSEDRQVTLTAKIIVGTAFEEKNFTFTVVKAETDSEYANILLDTLTLGHSVLTEDIHLPGEIMPDNASVVWSSSDPYEAEIDGFTLKLRRPMGQNVQAVLAAALTYKDVTVTKQFPVIVLRSSDKDMLFYKNIVSGDRDATLALDDKIDTAWTIHNKVLVIDLGTVKYVSEFNLVPYKNDINGLIISISSDNIVFESVFSGGAFAAGKLGRVIPEKAVFGRYLKFEFPDSAYGVSQLSGYNVGGSDASDVFAVITVPESATADFLLPDTISGSAANWISSSEAIRVVGTKAVVTRQKNSVNVILSVSVTIDGVLHEKFYQIYVPGYAQSGAASGGSSRGSSGGGITGSVIKSPYAAGNAESERESLTEQFTDLQSVPWAKEYIELLAAKGILSGRKEGWFVPDDYLTRAEMAKILVKAFHLKTNKTVEFLDVAEDSWYYDYVHTICSLGLANGIGDGRFGSDLIITRQDAFCMIGAALKRSGKLVEGNHLDGFPDKENIDEYAVDSVNRLAGLGIVCGDENGNINPRKSITRAEIAKIVAMSLQ